MRVAAGRPPAGRGLVRPVLFGLRYVLRHHLGRTDPLICGLVLTNRCNLRCRHCTITEREAADLGFDEVQAVVEDYYRRGGRCLYLQGGEPFLWRDGRHGLEDVVAHARAVGFLAVIVYTNGTAPLETSADTVFLSVGGLRETHDALRGPSFDRILRNVERSGHPSLFVNFTINRRNQGELEEFCALVDAEPRLRGTFFYLHTPYYGRDELALEPGEREAVLRRLLELTKRHRLLNSRAGLRSALRNDWRRPLAVCSVYEKGETFTCCRFPDDPALCRECGYLSYAEIDQTLRLRPSAVWNALKYF